MKLLWIILLSVLIFTGCTFGVEEMVFWRKDTGTDAGFPDDLEIDDTVWERELPPYFDDTQKEGR